MATRKRPTRKRRSSPRPERGRKKTLRLDQPHRFEPDRLSDGAAALPPILMSTFAPRTSRRSGSDSKRSFSSRALSSSAQSSSPRSVTRTDALLAAQCARLKATLLTSNPKDFRRLGRHLPVEVREPFRR